MSEKDIDILKKESQLLSTYVLLQLYNTLVLPYLNYCNMIWTAASETLLNKLQVLQKRLFKSLISLVCEHKNLRGLVHVVRINQYGNTWWSKKVSPYWIINTSY